MKKSINITMLIVLLVSVSFASGGKGEHKNKGKQGNASVISPGSQKTCPVSVSVGGTPVRRDSWVDYEGKRVYLCCDGCASAFNKDPERYVKKLEDMGEEVAVLASVTSQKTCPVMGGAVNKDLYVDKDGQRIYICCEGCRAQLEGDFEGYAKKLKEMGEQVEEL